MLKILTYITFCALLMSCQNEDRATSRKVNNRSTKKTKEVVKNTAENTLNVKNDAVVVLRLDSLKFQSFIDNGDDWIYEIDSDFGFGISNALEAFNMKNVTEEVTEKRYVQIEDCDGCPMLIDRDSINYGIILTGTNRKLKIEQGLYGQEYYLRQFNEYFK